jgi:hypothetical protein
MSRHHLHSFQVPKSAQNKSGFDIGSTQTFLSNASRGPIESPKLIAPNVQPATHFAKVKTSNSRQVLGRLISQRSILQIKLMASWMAKNGEEIEAFRNAHIMRLSNVTAQVRLISSTSLSLTTS